MNNNFFVTVVVCNNAFHNYAIITRNAAFENEKAAKMCLYGTFMLVREELLHQEKIIIAEMKDSEMNTVINIVCKYDKTKDEDLVDVRAGNPDLFKGLNPITHML